jgi:hypothetical protein
MHDGRARRRLAAGPPGMKRSSRAAVSIVAPFFCVRPVARDDLRFMLRAGRLPFDQGRVGMTDATRQIQRPISIAISAHIGIVSISIHRIFTQSAAATDAGRSKPLRRPDMARNKKRPANAKKSLTRAI